MLNDIFTLWYNRLDISTKRFNKTFVLFATQIFQIYFIVGRNYFLYLIDIIALKVIYATEDVSKSALCNER